jgi:hypothetical protein
MKALLGACVAAMAACAFGLTPAEMEQGFENPPDSAKPHVWWHWMNGNITKEGITADLEAMKDAGIGGAQIFNAAEGIPHGPIQFNSPEWIDMVKHAASEAQRLGLELCIHNCAGWSSSGGPWNTPEHNMKFVTTSEARAQGPAAFKAKLAQPPTNLDFYKDIAVVAFPTPVGERVRMADSKPVASCSAADQKASNLIDGNNGTLLVLPAPAAGQPAPWAAVTFEKPFAARTATLRPTSSMRGASGVLEVSGDGAKFRKLADIGFGKSPESRTFTFPRTEAKVWRVRFTKADGKMRRITLAELDLSLKCSTESLPGKTYRDRGDIGRGPELATTDEDVASVAKTQVLTSKMAPDGTLTWDVPAGDWTILRVGYTANGRHNHPAPTEATGPECDKLSKEALDAHWEGHMAKILAALGPLAGNVKSGLNNVLIDSYEVGTQNWTQDFDKTFKARMGYDITPWLPAFTGRIVNSQEETERFLWDLRRVISDLFAENYAGEMAALAHKAGMRFSCEPYGNCPSDDLQYGSKCDIPMSEFWPGGGDNPGNAKNAASAGHVYGRKYIGAESFTAAPNAGKWLKDPYSIKAQGDAVYCGGVNRIIYHRYAHQPWTNPTRYPGMTMGQWGTHFERTLTWWNQGKRWLKYQARCQYLLQEGQFVADVLCYNGENCPNSSVGSAPQGYDYDGICTDTLQDLTVKDGRLVLPSGMSYRLLVLPGGPMSPAVLKTIAKLVDAGATVIGRKPDSAPGLKGWPASDAEVKALADTLWPNKIRDVNAEAALKSLGLAPDFTAVADGAHVGFIHRVVAGADVYFVSCNKSVPCEVTSTFRVSGKVPELWDAETGSRVRAPAYTSEGGRTTVRLRFEPSGSVFVVFRQPESGDHAESVKFSELASAAAAPVEPLEIIKSEYGFFGEVNEPECADITKLVLASIRDGKRGIPASNEFAGGDPAANVEKELVVDYTIGGQKKQARIQEHGTFTVPNDAQVVRARYGLVSDDTEPPKPAVIDITAKVAAAVKNGRLAIVTGNDLAGRDPINLTVKETRTTYRWRGEVLTAVTPENAVLVLPEATGAIQPPAAELLAKADGSLTMRAWQPVSVTAATASGKTLTAKADVPAPVAIEGPWQLSFPPNWGAPASVTLDKLISWTQHSDTGVKYFSGTATYTKTFKWNAAAGRTFLDLGEVKNFAEVSLNGKAFPCLWKPPFRLDVTDALKAGDNALEVKVTNLWPNRLIGDEQLPDDRVWNGIRLKEWPKWVLEGKPSPTGRFTFTTWHHWHKDDRPLLSGIFGPVLLRTVVDVPLK